MEKEKDKEKDSKAMLIATIVASIVGICGFSWGVLKDVAKSENYATVSVSLNECETVNNRLLTIIDSLTNTPQQIVIINGESRSIINGQVIVTPDHYLSTSVRLKFTGADAISQDNDNYSKYFMDIDVRIGDRLYVKKNNSTWGINVLKISPTTIEVLRIE